MFKRKKSGFFCFSFSAVLALMVGMQAMVFSTAAAAEPATSYEQDQKIDQEMGVWDKLWKPLNLVNIFSRRDEPAQVKPGFPPYDQQVERAQDFRTKRENCYVDPQTLQVICL